MKQKEC